MKEFIAILASLTLVLGILIASENDDNPVSP